ncbi:arf-GAP with Rho-GAP domain, ANK repeat and PH domain-containing protein 1-like isoform X2 [Gigantopelta aegis]|uniref:arf-GAP with Rho-GAP domain, ANK repeat and PH domain-containing protein 1-like isoform X2 n=1 Tax=Gigantopelta aegis TaxID=1735272 RepID=UPI001B887E9B|nr:arf-GAP with Rho-GAP domain, ANK repeat and PH domain-containing protein 1-like isoform X2 [Gigantopelta aegis]
MAEQGGLNSPPPQLPPKHSAPSFREKKDVLGRASLINKPVPKPRTRTRTTHKAGVAESKVPTAPDRPVPRPRTRTQSSENIFLPKPYLESDLDSYRGGNANKNDSPQTANIVSDGVYGNVTTDDDDVYVNYEESEFKIPIDADEAGRMVEDMVNAQFANSSDACNNSVFDSHEQTARNSGGNNSHSKNIPVQRVEAIQRKYGQPMTSDAENSSIHRETPHSSKGTEKNNTEKQPIYDIQEFIGNRPGKPHMSPILIPSKISSLPSIQEPDTNTNLVFVSGTTTDSSADILGESSINDQTDVTSNFSPGDDESTYEPVWFPEVPNSDLLTFSSAANHSSHLAYKDNKTPPSNAQNMPRPLVVAAAAEPPCRSRDTVTKLNIVEQWGEYAKLDPSSSLCYEQPPPVYAPPPLPGNVTKSVAPPVPPRPCNEPESTNWTSSNSGSNLNQTAWAAFDHVSSSKPGNNTSFEDPPPSAIFQELATPQSNFYQDDPFKYSDFATECADFNKASDVQQQGFGGPQPRAPVAASEDFDPFNIKGEQTSDIGQTSSWTSPASSSSFDSLRMSMVPPPPGSQTFGRRDIPVDNLYSMELETIQDVESSDSSDEMYQNTDMIPGMGMAVPIVSSPKPKASERYGYLYKQGGVKANKGWQRRWVVFNGSDLRYYVNNKSQISKRVIPLSCMQEVKHDVQSKDKDRFKFILVTNLGAKGRSFQFYSETLDDSINWTSTLMVAINNYQKNVVSDVSVNSTTAPDKEGFVRFEPGKRYYVSITGSRLCYYHSFEDYKLQSPVHEIRMELASVKNVPGHRKCKLQLTTNYASFILAFDNVTDTLLWKMAMEDAIAEGLADDSVLMMVYKNDSNKICADCEDPNPHWASINLGIVLCKKCAGIHRMFDYRISKIRSLRMDTRVWTPSLIEMMISIGNANANNFWEFDLLPELKIEPSCNDMKRKQFIQEKYKDKKFIRPHRHQHDARFLNEELLRLAETDQLLDVMSVYLSGANNCQNHRLSYWSRFINYKKPGNTDEEHGTAYQIAKEAGQRLVMEFLYQNGGDSSASDLENSDDGRLREDVRLQGHLMKTGPNNRGFENRWCILEHGALTYYEKMESTKSKDSIDRKMILCVQESTAGSERQISAFELSTKKGANRIYLFGAENKSERGLWMRTIARLICPVSVMDHVGMMDFSLAGNFYMKNLITEDWRKTWLMLNWRVLYFVTVDSQLETIDLRKAKGIKYADTGSCESCMEHGKHFVIDTHGRHLYFQADLVRDTEKAFTALESAIKVSGTSLSDQQLTADDVPVIVNNCIGHIQVHGMKDRGIYREAATNSRIESLLNRLKADVYSVKLEEASCNEVANALKRFFRQLEDSLFTRDLYKEWIRTAAITDMNNKLAWYRYLHDKLPIVNKNTLKKLILHMWKVSQYFQANMMSVENLATCFAPSLMRTDSDNTGSSHAAGLPLEMAVVTDLMKNHEYIFQIEASDQKDSLIDEAAAKIAKANLNHAGRPQSCVFSDMMIPFHVMDSNGQSINVKVHNTNTAADILLQLRRKIPNSEDYVIYEVLKRGAIERPLLSFDYPLSAMMEWQNWEDDIRSEVKFIVKSNKTLNEIASAHDPGASLFAEIKCCAPGEKKLKKMAFKFIQAKLTSYKDAKSNHSVDEWNVEDLIFYHGVDPKRIGSGVSASQCITFVVKGEKQKSWFGRCMVFLSSEEKLKWMAALMTAQLSGKSLT